ncbi:blaR1 peptidase M56 [Dokdonia sinensis]|uniref:BlaR1 peptidase M56 n=1 Tax=Dokdonia sinensis TaxID=2479847 RepID=A0A3M0GC12_9FLAO|nr:M56 family metallopeptidase [Dokdonia sinensis]RMB59063.1 blaR1 peptidase M56 [Dokdonia sinensis]
MGQYIIEVLCFQAIFLAVYLTFFRKETFFQWNRGYLLLTPLLSMLLPFVSIAAFRAAVPSGEFATLLPEIFIGSGPDTGIDLGTEAGGFGINWLLIYSLGVLGALVFFGSKLWRLTQYFKYRTGGEKIIQIPESSAAFTFLNHIFIGEEVEPISRKRILAHEHIHVKQRHTWDLLYFEILRVIFWFNPFIYIFQKEITIVHEYLADAEAVRDTSKEEYFTQLLNATFGTQQLSFINSFFNHSFIKNRIIMLQKSKSKKIAIAKYALILPMIVGMLFYVSCSEDSQVEKTETSIETQLADLKLALEDRESLSDAETEQLQAILRQAENKNASDVEIIEVVEVQEVDDFDPNLDIPFAVIDNVPVFPGCESAGDNTARKKCMSESISKMVNRSFNTKLGSDLGLSGINRIFVQFKIDKNGNVTNVQSRAPHPELETEAERVIKLLPQMKPGLQKGKEVGVLYSLPITFKVE